MLEPPTQVLSREYCEFFKGTYFEVHLQMAASDTKTRNTGNRHRRQNECVFDRKVKFVPSPLY